MWILIVTLWTLPPDYLSSKGAIGFTREYQTENECLEAGMSFIRSYTAVEGPDGHTIGPIVKPVSFYCHKS